MHLAFKISHNLVPPTFWSNHPPSPSPPLGVWSVLSPRFPSSIVLCFLCLGPFHRPPPLHSARSASRPPFFYHLSVPYAFLPFKVTYIFLVATHVTLRILNLLKVGSMTGKPKINILLNKCCHMESNFKMSCSERLQEFRATEYYCRNA